MSTMQEFYTWLCQAPEQENPDVNFLVQLTQATKSDLWVLESTDGWAEWGVWGVEAA